MLAKKYRLKKDREFKKIYRLGRKIKEDFFVIRYLENNLPYSRFGFVIAKTVIKKATKRNLLKRKISEIIRLNQKKIITGRDIVVLIQYQPPDQKSQELAEKLLRLLKREQKFFLSYIFLIIARHL